MGCFVLDQRRRCDENRGRAEARWCPAVRDSEIRYAFFINCGRNWVESESFVAKQRNSTEGFTHYCGHLRSSGAFTVWRITATKRMVAKLKAIKVELQRRKHHRTSEVGEWLRKVIIPSATTELGRRLDLV